mmetsp:Transcript_25005/g.43881  ORF Transcript_25005/g.43881 Transcript_25005/m.43881 type:complete len:417 (-) Transcript_25005:2846-4096(-)
MSALPTPFKTRLELELVRLQTLDAIQFEWSNAETFLGNVFSVTLRAETRQAISFEVLITSKYPEEPPVLTCKTHFVKPSISDGRDLLREVVEWNSDLLMADWLPSLSGLVEKASSSQDLVEFGKFHLKSVYMLKTWMHPEFKIFDAVELHPKDVRYNHGRKLVLTPSYLLMLDHISIHPQVFHLVGYASLPSLQNIRSMKSNPDKLVLNWRGTDEEPAFSQTFRLSTAGAFLELLSKNIKALGVTVKKQHSELSLREDEVSVRRLESVDIQRVLFDITSKEEVLEKNHNIKFINELMNLYQRAIEYYSGVGDLQYDLYLKKMHSFLNDSRVLATLREQLHQGDELGDNGKSVVEKVNAEEIWPDTQTSQPSQLYTKYIEGSESPSTQDSSTPTQPSPSLSSEEDSPQEVRLEEEKL